MPRVSILLPVRDAEAHLPAAIASLAAQRYRDFDVLAVDDGSADASRDLLEAWAAADARVRVLESGGTGIVAALCHAARHAGGELLARMDADDVAHADRLAEQVALLDAHPDLAACGTGVRYVPDHLVRDGARRYERWLNSLTSPDAIRRDLFIECPIAHPTLMVRADSFRHVGGYRTTDWAEDYDLVLRLDAAGYALSNVPRVLHDWREGTARLSRTDARYGADAFRRCKVHHLAGRLQGRSVIVCGAGPIGKAFARTLLHARLPLLAFCDVDRRKIGQNVYGAPVIAPSDLDAHTGQFAVAAVGAEAGREAIRADLTARGWSEGIDFVAIA